VDLWPGAIAGSRASQPSAERRRPKAGQGARLAVSTCLALLLLAPAGSARRLPDRDALIVLPQGMPVTVERSTFFEDGGLMSVRLRNGGFDAARARIRIVVFADRRRLVGSASYCAGQM
jgi:hypothetical protein